MGPRTFCLCVNNLKSLVFVGFFRLLEVSAAPLTVCGLNSVIVWCALSLTSYDSRSMEMRKTPNQK